jgi:SAM-dependent methyltransferase
VERLDQVLWQSYAHLYDGLLDVYAYQDMLQRVATLADCFGRTVLDVGGGTGNVTRALLRAGAAHVTLVDASSNMLGHARRKLANEVVTGQVQIRQGDALAIMASLPAGSVDRISAVNFLYVLPSRIEFFHQARRILAPGGFIIASHTTRPGSGPIVREQFRRGGVRGTLRPRLLGIAAIDLVIDLLANGGRYDFAPVRVLADEAAGEGLPLTRFLGRTYGGKVDGVNELLSFTTSTSS